MDQLIGITGYTYTGHSLKVIQVAQPLFNQALLEYLDELLQKPEFLPDRDKFLKGLATIKFMKIAEMTHCGQDRDLWPPEGKFAWKTIYEAYHEIIFPKIKVTANKQLGEEYFQGSYNATEWPDIFRAMVYHAKEHYVQQR